jgi:drug/metabolite transporter (DMT)-like permease
LPYFFYCLYLEKPLVMPVRKSMWIALIPLFVVYLVFGTTFGSIRVGVSSLPWILVPCVRFLIAGFLLALFCSLRKEPFPSWKECRKHAIAGLLLFSGGNTMVCWAVQHMPSGMAGLLVATMPFWMLGLSAIIPPREKVSVGAIVGMLVGFSGMLILLSPHLGHSVKTPPLFWWGVLSMFLNTFFWALGSIYVRKNPSTISLPMRVAIQNITAGVSLIPVCLYTIPAGTTLHPSSASLTALAYLVVFGTCIAGPCYLYMMKNLPVPISSTFAYVTPVITVIFGWLFLGEELTETTIKGMGVIITGVIVVQWVSFAAARKQAKPATVVSPKPVDIDIQVIETNQSYTGTGTASISIASRR